MFSNLCFSQSDLNTIISKNWLFETNNFMNASTPGSDKYKVLNSNEAVKEILVGERKHFLYRGIYLSSLENEYSKAMISAIDKVYPFKMGKMSFVEYSDKSGSWEISVEVNYELNIDTPIGKRDIYVVSTIFNGKEKDSGGVSRNGFLRTEWWVDKNLSILWGRKIFHDFYGEAQQLTNTGAQSFYVVNIKR
jgi:hypothetical protein